MTKTEKLKDFENSTLNAKNAAEHELRKLQTINVRHGSGFRWATPFDLIKDIFENCINATIRKEALETYTNYIRQSSIHEYAYKFLVEYDSSFKTQFAPKEIRNEH